MGYGQKVQTFIYKVGTNDVIHNMMTIVSIAVVAGKLLRELILRVLMTGKMLFFIWFPFLLYLSEVMDAN